MIKIVNLFTLLVWTGEPIAPPVVVEGMASQKVCEDISKQLIETWKAKMPKIETVCMPQTQILVLPAGEELPKEKEKAKTLAPALKKKDEKKP